jgi:hypothetical protein
MEELLCLRQYKSSKLIIFSERNENTETLKTANRRKQVVIKIPLHSLLGDFNLNLITIQAKKCLQIIDENNNK